MGYANDLLGQGPTTFTPDAYRTDDETVKLVTLKAYAEFIQTIGWVEHTNDWDLAFEITLKTDEVIAVHCLDLRKKDPHDKFGEFDTAGDHIHYIVTDDEDIVWTQPEELEQNPPPYIDLADIKEINYT